MDAIKFLKERNRMCHKGLCDTCPVGSVHNKFSITCGNFMKYHPEEYLRVVQQWSKEHPAKTRLSVLKEQYPAIKEDEFVFSNICAGDLYGFVCGDEYADCVFCWNVEVE